MTRQSRTVWTKLADFFGCSFEAIGEMKHAEAVRALRQIEANERLGLRWQS